MPEDQQIELREVSLNIPEDRRIGLLNTTRLKSTCVTAQGSTQIQTIESNHRKSYKGNTSRRTPSLKHAKGMYRTYFKLYAYPKGLKGNLQDTL